MEKSKKIYLDNAAATPLDSKVLSAMIKILKENYANSSAIHDLGVKNKNVLENSRKEIANILKAHQDEVIFTSGATESNNIAILGIIEKIEKLEKSKNFIPHIITTNIEHVSVLETCRYLEKNKKAEITFISVEENGIIDVRKIRKAVRSNTVLISVMYANNEIGTIQPIQEIAKEIRHFNKINNKKVLLHTDATQAVNYLDISNVEKLGVDLMSFNAGKIYGPKGVGVLYIKRKAQNFISKVSFGGEHEFNFRPGTENLANIVGLTEALKITEKIKQKESARLVNLRNYLLEKIVELDSEIKININGDLEKRLPNNLNITIQKVPSDLLVLELSARGIYVSEKSACKSGDKKSSYVIKAICRKDNGSIRFSLGRQTKKEDIDYVIRNLKQILKKLEKWYY